MYHHLTSTKRVVITHFPTVPMHQLSVYGKAVVYLFHACLYEDRPMLTAAEAASMMNISVELAESAFAELRHHGVLKVAK